MITFTKVRLVGLSNIDLPLVGATETDKYILKTADGLGPVKNEIFLAQTKDRGDIYHGRRSNSREIVLTVQLQPDWFTGETPGMLRDTLYGLLSPGYNENITVQFLNAANAVVAQTVGYVSDMEPAPFDKDTTVQITIPCPSPFFQAPDVVKTFSAAFTEFTVAYDGSAPAGFLMRVPLSTNQSIWSIRDGSDVNNPNTKTITLTYPFLTGDTLIVDTRAGSRNVSRIRSGATLNLFPYLSDASQWLQLYRGTSPHFYMYASNPSTATFTYTPQYWGI